eukprot:scaffold73406_cov26-Attheya_sp.AAC.1
MREPAEPAEVQSVNRIESNQSSRVDRMYPRGDIYHESDSCFHWEGTTNNGQTDEPNQSSLPRNDRAKNDPNGSGYGCQAMYTGQKVYTA